MPNPERTLLHEGGRQGSWGSLGLWPTQAAGAESPTDYASACETLTRRVADAAQLQPGARVLAVACGAGDELRLLALGYQACEVFGLEHNQALVLSARLCTQALQTPVTVLEGDGTALDRLGLRPASFDAVICVDAAYHLRPQEAFLRQTFELLRPGGWLAYTDLCLEGQATPGRAALLRGAAACCGLSADDLLPDRTQVERLRQLGFEPLQPTRLDSEVLDGFARFAHAQGRRLARTALHRDWRRVALTAQLIRLCRRAGLGYVLLAGQRPSSVSATA